MMILVVRRTLVRLEKTHSQRNNATNKTTTTKPHWKYIYFLDIFY